jgi:hypothetical protein
MYVKSVSHLHLERRWDLTWHHPEYVGVIDELLVCLLRACFDRLIEAIRVHCDVRLVNDFEFDLKLDEEGRDPFFAEHRVVSWRLFNLEARERKEQARWYEAFEEHHGISSAAFMAQWEEELRQPRRTSQQAHRHLARRLSAAGISLRPQDCRAIMNRLLTHHRWRVPDSLLALADPKPAKTDQ